MPCTYSEIVDKWLEPDFKFFINREGSITERMNFLKQNNNMKDEYLGACLDYIRWGGQTVLYELGTTGLIGFIQDWMNLNKDNLIWSQRGPPIDFTLPHIKHDKCPRDEKHKGKILDSGERIRCAHINNKNLKPNYIESYSSFDKLADIVETNIWDSEPQSPPCDDDGDFLCDDEDIKKYEENLKKYNDEKTIIVPDVCYAILNDEKIVLPLEKVLDRLNLEPKYKTVYCGDRRSLDVCRRPDESCKESEYLDICQGHIEENNQTVHPFSGWTLALYVQKWYEQRPNGQAPVFEKKK